jgi:hypothetical protein
VTLGQLRCRGGAFRCVVDCALDRHRAEEVTQPATVNDPNDGAIRGLIEYQIVAGLDG